jgi:hypothetical protein
VKIADDFIEEDAGRRPSGTVARWKLVEKVVAGGEQNRFFRGLK